MSIALLDVNVLIALLDDRHIHHRAAHVWFDGDDMQGWATCPITENGFIRIVGQPSYQTPFPAEVAMEVLQGMCMHEGHVFWADDVSLPTLWAKGAFGAPASRHVTDTYLVALASAHGGRLATFDRRIAARSATLADHILTIGD